MKFGIKAKLILSLLLANGLLVCLMYALTTQSFDRGFLAYVNQAETQKLQPLLDDLSQYYQDNEGWQWVHQRRDLWRDLMDKHVLGEPETARLPGPGEQRRLPRRERRPPPGDGSPPQGMDFSPPPGPPPPRQAAARSARLNIDPRLMLRDQQQRIIIGNGAAGENVQWLPISVNAEVVGELGVKSLNNLSAKLDVIFAAQQRETFATIAMVLLLAALLLAMVIAGYFLRPLRLIKQGVHRLVSGEYEQSLEVNSGDELGQLARDFNLLARTLKDNQQSRQQWIADISHELRTPVAILQGELDALLEGVRKVDRQALTSLQQESRRLGGLINDLHELSLSDLGALTYNKERLDLVELLEDFFTTHESRIEKARVSVAYDLPDVPCMILADGDRLDQCFKNLLQNTLRYTEQPGQLNIRLVCDNMAVTLYWEDSSPGVSDEELKHLFERLYRVEQSRNRAKGGAGLGMSICKNIIQAHDAKVSLYHSRLGGLGLRIDFPL